MAEAAELELNCATSTTTRRATPTSSTRNWARRTSRSRARHWPCVAFEKTLSVVPNDPFTLSGLAQAQAPLAQGQGRRDVGTPAVHLVRRDRRPQPLAARRALGLSAQPVDRSPGKQRNYARTSLDQHGPAIWTANPAPALDARDAAARVTLEEFKGKNVLLVFYLGGTCVHCLTQLKQIGDQKSSSAASTPCCWP